MYHLRVEEVGTRRMSELVPTSSAATAPAAASASSSGGGGHGDGPAAAAAGSDVEHDFMEVFREPLEGRECVEFSVGNPRVEHIAGIVHLYKANDVAYGSAEPRWRRRHAPAGAAAAATEADASLTLCCLAIPADMSVANFCSFIGAYLREVRSIQVLRREGSQPSVCMVLLTFADQEQADSFYTDFNGVPFSSLEPDILCRLVFVRSVEVLSSRGRPPPPVSLPAAANALTAAAATAAAAGSKQPDEASSSTPKAAAAAAAQAAAGSAPAPAGEQASSSDKQQQQQQQAKDKQDAQHATSSSSSPKTATPTYAAALGGSGGGSAAAAAAAAAPSPAPSTPTAAAAAAPQHWLEPPPGTTELPTCPVCLERLDEHISGIVTTVCNHRFHGECLKHWGDTSCPVCRHCMLSSSTTTSRCSTCGSNTNLWICLICGHVGCGRYKQGHANDHWKASAHCYALELETQRVWDYAGDGYVHRLIQSKTDGKLVEVPSPAPTCPHGSPSPHHHHHHHHHHHRGSARSSRHASRSGDGSRPGLQQQQHLGRSRSGSSATAAAAAASSAGWGVGDEGDDDDDGLPCPGSGCPVCADEQAQMKEAMVESKLEVITLEYNHLLASQLDSQRQYFEGLLAAQDAKAGAVLAGAKSAAEQAQAASSSAAAAAKESERKRQQLEHKLSELTASVSKVGEEREFLRSLNETLLSNQREFNARLAASQAEVAAKDAQLQDLHEQVRDLMVFIEAQRTIQAAGGASELQGATLLPVPAQQAGKKQGGGSSRRASKK